MELGLITVLRLRTTSPPTIGALKVTLKLAESVKPETIGLEGVESEKIRQEETRQHHVQAAREAQKHKRNEERRAQEQADQKRLLAQQVRAAAAAEERRIEIEEQ